MTNLVLPQAIREVISKLPDATRDVIAQRLRNAPSPPVLYEDAVRQLAAVRDIDTTKRVLLAAEGLALWGKLHEDNRAILEAQKLKAHALRQMFICAKLLGEPYEILQEKRVWRDKARRGEELASFEQRDEIDLVAEAIGVHGRAEFLVGRIADESPLARSTRRENDRESKEAERKWRAEERKKEADPKYQFKTKVLNNLLSARAALAAVEDFDLANCSSSNKKLVLDGVRDLLEILDRLDLACKARRVRQN